MKLQIALIFLILSFSAAARVRIEEELYIPGRGPEVIRELIRVGSVEIDHVTSEGFEVYGSKGLSQYLEQRNILHFDMLKMKAQALVNYPTFLDITQKLKAAAARYPRIMRLMSIGRSVSGRDLWVMKISDNVESDETEPEFKYISSMHGDEITGRELTVRFIEEIGERYGRDGEITALVNNTEIYIMPSMNPDGSEMKRRANANGVDLNRNFPDMTRDRESTPRGREIENQHVMQFQASRKFALSANFHGGTIVANYPWDSIYDLHPLDNLVQEFSQGYAERNPEMRNSREFPGGITNGAKWYVVRGGMQDWSYVWHNDLQITIELSHEKWPNYSQIPGFYQSNRDSMVYFMKEVHRGAGFKINRPNIQGVVTIQDERTRMNYGTYAFSGSEFYKVLPEGLYSFWVKENAAATPKLVRVSVEKDIIRPNGNFQLLD